MNRIFLRTILFASLIVIGFASCKKKDSTTPANNTTAPPDVHANDSIKIGNTKYSFSSRSNYVNNNMWKPYATYNSGSYTIYIYTGATVAPTSNVTFTVIPPQTTQVVPPLTATQAYIFIMNGANYESWQGGTMVCTVSNGTIRVQITGMTVSTTAVSTQYPFSLYLTLP